MGPLKHKGQKNTKKKMDQGYILAFFFIEIYVLKLVGLIYHEGAKISKSI